ncbi:Glutaredoxin-like protein NrdH [Paraliobacillus sp. PM-2]|uniref:glutaredoxin family protein n=1 Tax=Paraliobacillus sp. PM-2 TaxID=1462524 RepID=UPI00061C00EE|nr:glutaredoxin domain-containing protein [Paraliobacillus sp. PM-2]CQR47926.1 Glutaredoxin-like protein NrdH [Paraliobacillus sp. PM-2]
MKQMTVYTTTSCPYCVMLKNYLSEQNISFNEINMEEKPEAMRYVVESTGQMGVPQSEVNGKWIIGFDPEQIMHALKMN